MMKNFFFPTFFILVSLQLICMAGMVCAEDLNSHSAYKVTSYDLGSLHGFAESGVLGKERNFKPLLITSTTADILNSEHERAISLGETESHASNLNSIAVSAQFDATSRISIHGALGLTRNLWTPDLLGTANDSSWEANLGVIYKLLNNLSYELHFGYMDVGDLFIDRSSYSDVENIIMISNQLSLSF